LTIEERDMRVKREPKDPTIESSGEAPTTTAPTAPPAPAAPAARTIRVICEEAILAGKTTDQVLAAVAVEHPTNRTSKGCVSWYRSKMVKKGQIPTSRPRG
jgi:hypothetical protein